jgi:hypothetical protein
MIWAVEAAGWRRALSWGAVMAGLSVVMVAWSLMFFVW